MAAKAVDPWARYEAWRSAGSIGRKANVARMLPGFAIGFAAFVVAVGIEKVMEKKQQKKH